MKYTYEKAEKSQIKLTIDFDKADWDKAINDAYFKNKGKFNVPGFRKGHVPFHVVVGMYGKEFFYEDAINIAITEHYPEILKKETENIYSVGDPDFSLNDVSENGVSVTAMIPVMPDIKIGSYKGIKVEKVEYNVSDDEINAEIDRLIDRNAKEISVTDRSAQKGDIVVIDYSGSIDGVKFDGGTAEKQRLELGSGSFIPGFEDQVIGMAIGEERNISVTFPEDYTAPLNGKAAVFAIKLHEIIVKEKPELTDAFVKDATGEESIDAYKAHIKKHKQEDNDRRAQNENEDKLLSAIAETTEGEIPDAMIEHEIDSLIQQFTYRLMYQGLKYEDYLKVTNQTEEKVRESYRAQAQDRVKKQLIVNKIIELESIKAEQSEIDEKVAAQAKSVGKETEEYKKTMDPKQFDYIANEIVVDKFFKFLTENNEFVAKKAEKKTTTKKTVKKAEENLTEEKPAEDKSTEDKPVKKTTAKKSSTTAAKTKKTDEE